MVLHLRVRYAEDGIILPFAEGEKLEIELLRAFYGLVELGGAGRIVGNVTRRSYDKNIARILVGAQFESSVFPCFGELVTVGHYDVCKRFAL